MQPASAPPSGPPGRHRELPPGLTDRLPDEAERLHRVRQACLEVMNRWGYRLVLPPLLEHAEVFDPAPGVSGDHTVSYRFVDRLTGHVLAIRPDFTPQVARMAGTRFAQASLPLRLCYEGPVVRHVPGRRGLSREVPQVGAELLGVADPEADAEGIAVLVACLREAGLGVFKVDLGQVEFFRGLVQDLEVPPEQMEALRGAVARKDLSDLERLLAELDIPERRRAALAELPLLAGGVEVLERAEALVDTDHSRRALDNLARVVDYVDTHGLRGVITVDLGEIRGIDYHTGVIYEVFVPHLGSPLARGGRYDHLCGRYGRELPATGFTLDLAALLAAEALGGPAGVCGPRGVFIVNFAPERARALRLARALRARGVRAARDMIRRPLDDSLHHARAQGFRWAAVIDPANAPGDQVRWVDLKEGAETVIPEAQVPERAAREE